MSENHGTALPSSADAPSDGLTAWINGMEDTAPLDVVDRPVRRREDAGERAGEGAPLYAGVERLRENYAVQAQTAQLEMDRHREQLGELSDRERDEERRAVETLRRMRRNQQLDAAKAGLRRAKMVQRADDRAARQDCKDRVWQRAALAKRTRLQDSTSRLAALHRTHAFASVLLVGVAVAGIAWTASGVHDALVGPSGSPLAYLVEPLFSLPLLVIMLFQARAAQWGRRFPDAQVGEDVSVGRRRERKVYVLEGALLAATVAVNSSPVLPGVGVWRDTVTLLAHLAPPALILVAVTLHPMIATFVSGVMTTAYVDPAGNETRLSDDEQATAVLARRIAEDWESGQLRESPTGGPSINHAQKIYALDKRKVQRAVDLWAVLYG